MLSAQNAVRCWDVRDARLLVLIAFCGEGGVVQRSLQREKDSGDSGK